MSEFKYGILCEQAIISRETGQLSIINVVNGLGVPSVPVVVNTLFLAMSWQRDMQKDLKEEKFEIRILVEPRDPEIRPPVNDKFEVIFSKDNFVANAVTRLDVEFSQSGENRLIIERKYGDDWKAEGIVPIKIVSGIALSGEKPKEP